MEKVLDNAAGPETSGLIRCLYNITDTILKFYFAWGMALAVILKMCDIKRPYYQLGIMALTFVLLTYLLHRELHLREFTIRYWKLTAVVILCILFQTVVLNVKSRVIMQGLLMYLLIYSGFLYGKRYFKSFDKTLKLTAIMLGASSVVGLIWWVLEIYPVENISLESAKYFYSAPNRMVSVFVHPIIAGCFMLLLLSITLFTRRQASYEEKGPGRFIDGALRYVMLFIGIAGLYATLTRSAYIVFVAMPFVWALGQWNVKKRSTAEGQVVNPQRMQQRIFAGICVILLVFVMLYVTGAVGTIYARFFGVNWQDDPSYTFRIDTIKVTVDEIVSRDPLSFLFGKGAGKGRNILRNTDWIMEKYEVVPAIDNSLSTMFLEQGFIAFVLFLLEFLYVLKRCIFPVMSMAGSKNRDFKNTMEEIQWVYYLLLPQLVMAITFDAQTWTGTEFVIFVLIGMEMSCRPYSHPGFDIRHPLIINGRIFSQPVTGVQRYGIEIIKQIDKVTKPGEVFLALPRCELETEPDFENIVPVTVGRGKGNVWTQVYLPIFAVFKRGTILSLAGIAPVMKPDYIATHDISFMRYPESYGKNFRLIYRIGYLFTLYRCKGIFTVSEFSRDELMTFYQLDESRFVLAGNSAEQLLTTSYKEEDLSKWGIGEGEKYYLSVGSKNLHKNQLFVRKLAERYPDKKFVIAGGSSARSFGESGKMKGADNITFTGYITDDELLTLYARAHAFIFPSLYEGFGIPPMEAIISGVKHIALADIPVLREIYDRGCYFFDPTNEETFDISRLDDDGSSGDDRLLITEEIKEYYLGKYSWKNSAESMLECIQNI